MTTVLDDNSLSTKETLPEQGRLLRHDAGVGGRIDR
jgi:hypothetical protein